MQLTCYSCYLCCCCYLYRVRVVAVVVAVDDNEIGMMMVMDSVAEYAVVAEYVVVDDQRVVHS